LKTKIIILTVFNLNQIKRQQLCDRRWERWSLDTLN